MLAKLLNLFKKKPEVEIEQMQDGDETNRRRMARHRKDRAIRLYDRGLTINDIAEQLLVKPRTVYSYLEGHAKRSKKAS